ncbi:MAG TPA: carbohydrate-binding family 9-like protein [Candidatus Bathyarchaeia archaeon]|nr:carbohydrate-binding family 9-like protein [Candidatus Bathyarchaeia archaeon]
MNSLAGLEYTVARVPAGPALDGDFDGPGWRRAAPLDINQFRPESGAHRPRTQGRLLYMPDALFVSFRVEDRYVRCVTTEYQGPVYRDACVEFFVEPKAGKGYFNFEMNCGGALLLRHVTNPDRTSGELAGFTNIPWQIASKIEIYHSMPETVDPEIVDPVAWVVQYTIPLELFEPYIGRVGDPAGQTWRGNFYKCAENNSHPHYASWSPVGGPLNFHQPDYFAPIVFQA